MRVEYSRRALSDLIEIATFYAESGNQTIGERVARRIREVVARIARFPQSGRPVSGRPNVRVVFLRRYPYLVFYQTRSDTIRIVHIRHTARQQWPGR
jgi:toxin ParE1/3/4